MVRTYLRYCTIPMEHNSVCIVPRLSTLLLLLLLLQEKLDIEVLCKEDSLLPASAEHPEEFEDLSGAGARAAVGSRRY